MKHLPLSDCRWLKFVGFPQENRGYYYVNGKDPVVMSDLEITLYDERPLVICACPTLEPLLEWAITKDKSIRIYKSTDGWAVSGGVDIVWDGDLEVVEIDSTNPDPKVAIIKLLKQVLSNETN